MVRRSLAYLSHMLRSSFEMVAKSGNNKNGCRSSTLTCLVISLCVICNISQTLQRTQRRIYIYTDIRWPRRWRRHRPSARGKIKSTHTFDMKPFRFFTFRNFTLTAKMLLSYSARTHWLMWIIEVEMDSAAEVCTKFEKRSTGTEMCFSTHIRIRISYHIVYTA